MRARGAGEAAACRAPAIGPDHVQAHRDCEEQVDEDLDLGRLGLQPEHSREQRAAHRARLHEPAQVDRLRLHAVDPAGLVGRVGGRGQEPGGDQDQDETGHTEEPGQVDPHAAEVDEQAERDRCDQPDHGARAGRGRVGGVLERGEHEHRRLEALSQDGEESHSDKSCSRARHERLGHMAFELSPKTPRVPAHPDDHVGDHRDGDQADDRLQPLLLALRQVLSDQPERHRDGDADGDGQADAEPHRAERIAPALLHQECRDDPDDQRGFDALAQGDDESGDQGVSPAGCVMVVRTT